MSRRSGSPDGLGMSDSSPYSAGVRRTRQSPALSPHLPRGEAEKAERVPDERRHPRWALGAEREGLKQHLPGPNSQDPPRQQRPGPGPGAGQVPVRGVHLPPASSSRPTQPLFTPQDVGASAGGEGQVVQEALLAVPSAKQVDASVGG